MNTNLVHFLPSVRVGDKVYVAKIVECGLDVDRHRNWSRSTGAGPDYAYARRSHPLPVSFSPAGVTCAKCKEVAS